jgi:hypothetical protein
MTLEGFLKSNKIYNFEINHFDDQLKEIKRHGYENLDLLNNLYKTLIKNRDKSSDELYELKTEIKEALDFYNTEIEILSKYIYKTLIIGSYYYKVKTLLTDTYSGDSTVRYVIASCQSEQEMRSLLANLQKGTRSIRVGGNYDRICSVKNGYRALYLRTKNENIGDGVHAIIYNESDSILKIHKDKDLVNEVYKFVLSKYKTGLLPEWGKYIYDKLVEENMIRICDGFDYTGKAPKVVIFYDELDTNFFIRIKQEGLSTGKISLPVENNIAFNQDATFYELVTEYVLPYLQDENLHYNVGDKIDSIIASKIDIGKGKVGKLYPRQQVIAQGFLEAIRDGKYGFTLNGDMGIGKTYISGKLALAVVHEFNNNFVGRIAVYCQGQLIEKWKREIIQVSRPLGITPSFITLNSYMDVKKLKRKPIGLEVLLIPKDKAKRNYQVEMAVRKPYNSSINDLRCPDCGGHIYSNSEYIFDIEKCDEYLSRVLKNRSSLYSKCNHYIKVDGSPLTKWEIERIRENRIKVLYEDEYSTNVYFDEDGYPLQGEELRKVKSYKESGYTIAVRKCNASLWTAKRKKGYNTFNAVEMLKKHIGTKAIDITIADEAHLFNRESNQGMTYATLVEISKVAVNLTGTLTGGKASDLFYQLYRMYPDKLKKMGYKYSDVNLFIDHYGRREKTTKQYYSEYNASGKGKKISGAWQEKSGISPLLYTNFLSGIMISRSITDMDLPMPELKFFKHEIKMSDELRKAYDRLKQAFVTFMRENKGVSLGGSYIHNLLSYPDNPNQEPIYVDDTRLVANPEKLDMDQLFPKEEKLLETIRQEVSLGRNTLVYSIYSGTKGVSKRLLDIISKEGIKVIELKSTVAVEKREAWIEKKYQEGYEVIITNPTCVQTGLNITQYPTIYFYECGYDIKVLRQAERRAWRMNQDKVCKVYYSYYVDTIQEDAMKLIGSKKKASLAIEGVFSEDLLSSMGSDSDDGAKMLFNVLKGKIKLKENELDAFNFEEEEVIIPEYTESVEKVEKSVGDGESQQLSLFTLSYEDVKEDKYVKKKGIVEGQLSLFAM